jgi:hypothetical protein
MSQPAAQRENFVEYWQMAEAVEAALEVTETAAVATENG